MCQHASSKLTPALARAACRSQNRIMYTEEDLLRGLRIPAHLSPLALLKRAQAAEARVKELEARVRELETELLRDK